MFSPAIKKSYSFDVYPSAILGTDFKNVTVLAIMDMDSASQIIDTAAAHVSIYPYLPSGTPNDPSKYTYIKIKTSSGITTVLAVEWIKENTVTDVTSTSATVKIGGINPEDISRIRNALVANGFNNLLITVDEEPV
jgi:hypothetical protein